MYLVELRNYSQGMYIIFVREIVCIAFASSKPGAALLCRVCVAACCVYVRLFNSTPGVPSTNEQEVE